MAEPEGERAVDTRGPAGRTVRTHTHTSSQQITYNHTQHKNITKQERHKEMGTFLTNPMVKTQSLLPQFCPSLFENEV